MKRLALLGSWKRLGIQLGLLTGLGLAFVGDDEKAQAGVGVCPGENECSFKKPNFMIIMDYSSSMNSDFDNVTTRWDAAVTAVQAIVTANNGYFDNSMHLGLLRYGHDPEPNVAGTLIANDPSGIVDGQALDVHWYDPANDPSGYFECNGQAIVDFLDNVAAPLCQGANCFGIGTWTDGALLFAQSLIAQTRLDHPTDVIVNDERFYATMVVTDGNWTDPVGSGQNAANDPVDTAADLYATDNVPTYVVAFGDAAGLAFADDMALAGGTGVSIQPMNPQDLIDALQAVITDITDDIIVPICIGGLPRMMVVLDASSSMLNVNMVAGAEGTTGWDQARAALVGANALFDVPVGNLDATVEDLVHLGLITFGLEGDDVINVDYGPCMQDNFEWAIDPNTSCAAGCNDPWGGPPIAWTFVGPGDAGYPGFDADTTSVMPRCDPGVMLPGGCTGSGTATHTGLVLANTNAQNYRANPPALYPIDPSTTFANILITDGAYATYSTDAQVSAELIDMYANFNTTTYVIGFGDGVADTELDNMACWGSGGVGTPCELVMNVTLPYYDANNQMQLEAALQQIIADVNFDPCCNFNNCSLNPEPTTGEIDPIDPTATSSGGGESSGGGSSSDGGTDTTGAVSASATDGGSSDGGSGSEGSTSNVTDTATGSATDPDTGDSGSASNSGTEDSASASATATDSDSLTDTNADSSGSSGGASGGESLDDDGCGCSTESGPRGLLGTFMAFGLAVGVRRRRRVS